MSFSGNIAAKINIPPDPKKQISIKTKNRIEIGKEEQKKLSKVNLSKRKIKNIIPAINIIVPVKNKKILFLKLLFSFKTS